MRVALDFHRTLTAQPKLFLTLVRGFQAAGWTWGVVTAMPDERQVQLDWLGTHGFPPPDFYVSKPLKLKAMPNVIWKASQMTALEVDFLFDDLDTGRIGIYDSAGEVRSRRELARGGFAG